MAVVREDWGPRTDGPRETPGTAVAPASSPAAVAPAISNTRAGMSTPRPDWGPRTDGPRETPGAALVPAAVAPALPNTSTGMSIPRPDWGVPAAGAGLGGRETGNAVVPAAANHESAEPAAEAESGEDDEDSADEDSAESDGEEPDPVTAFGRDADRELAAIQKTMRENRRAYDRDPKMQARLLELLEARDNAKEIAQQAEQTQTTVQAILDAAPDASAFEVGFESVFEDLPEPAQLAIRHELTLAPDTPSRAASEADLMRFATTEEGAQLVKEWGRDAGKKFATVRARLDRMILRGGDMEAAVDWFEQLTSQEAGGVLRALAGRG